MKFSVGPVEIVNIVEETVAEDIDHVTIIFPDGQRYRADVTGRKADPEDPYGRSILELAPGEWLAEEK